MCQLECGAWLAGVLRREWTAEGEASLRAAVGGQDASQRCSNRHMVREDCAQCCCNGLSGHLVGYGSLSRFWPSFPLLQVLKFDDAASPESNAKGVAGTSVISMNQLLEGHSSEWGRGVSPG